MTFSGHIPRKNFGQHWLKNTSILRKIIEAAEISSSDIILEIGPGKGALTKYLLASLALFTYGIELDRDLALMLREQLKFNHRLAIIEGDALQIELPSIGQYKPNKVVANIPYNITGPLLAKLLGTLEKPATRPYEKIVLLVQKELADRICAYPGSKQYSALSVRIQLLAKCYTICKVSPSCFQPSPSVMSSVLILDPFSRHDHLECNIAFELDKLVTFCFASRRKMLRSTLTHLIPVHSLEKLINKVGINLNQRPQEISPNQWVKLAMGLVQTDS